MAIGTPVSLGTPVASSTSLTTIPLTTTSTVAAGDGIVVAIGYTTGTVSSVADTNGNTYTVDRVQLNGAAGVAIAACPQSAGLASGGVITVTYSVAQNRRYIAAWSVSGLASPAIDKVTGANQFNATAWSSGATAALAQADEIVFGASIMHGVTSTSTAGATYTELADWTLAAIGSLTVEYKIVAATTAVTATGTWAAASGADNATLVATYKGAAAATVLPTLTMPTFQGAF